MDYTGLSLVDLCHELANGLNAINYLLFEIILILIRKLSDTEKL